MGVVWISDGCSRLDMGEKMVELHARSSDPETSHEAMAEYDDNRMENAIDWVVAMYSAFDKLADFQLKELFDKVWQGRGCGHLYQQARSVARDRGHIIATKERIVNPKSKRKQIVWKYCENPKPVTIHYCETCGKVISREGGTEE